MANKIFNMDFRTGGQIEKIIPVTPTTFCPMVKTDKGLAINSKRNIQTCVLSSGCMPFGSGNFSIETYVYIDPNNKYTTYIFGAGGSGVHGVSIYFSGTSGSLTCRVIDATAHSIAPTVNGFQLGKWNHIVATCNRSGNIIVWLNNVAGTPVSMSTIVGTLTNTGYGSALMAFVGINTDVSTGYMSFFRIWDAELSQNEIIKLYGEALNSYPVVQEKYPQAGIINKPLDLSREKGNTVGNDLVSGWDFTSANWTTSSATKIDNNTFTTSGTGGIRNNTYSLLLGVSYRLRIRLKVTAGIEFRIWDWGVANTYWVCTGTGDYVSYDTTITITAIGTNGIFLRITNTAQCDIDYWYMEPYLGLIAAYNMIPNGSTLVDISGNGKNHTISKFTSIPKGIKTASGYLDTGVPSFSFEGDFSISIRVKPLSVSGTSTFICQVGSGTSAVWVYRNSATLVLDPSSGGTATFACFYLNSEITLTITFVNSTHTTTLYVNGIPFGSPTTNYNPSGSRTATCYVLGISAVSEAWRCKDEVHDLRIYNRILSTNEIKQYHNSFVNPSLVCDFSDEGASGIAF